MSDAETLTEIELALQLQSKGHITSDQTVNTIAHLVRVNHRRNR